MAEKEKYWKRRATHGRKRIFETPELLQEACEQYFEWVEENPIIESNTTHYMGNPITLETPKLRPMTIEGICNFIGITNTTWADWRKMTGLAETVAWAEQIIYDQKFSGAAAGVFNSAIIIRQLGLADKSDHTSSDGSMTPKDVSADLVENLANKLVD